jgi:hypothetical protein
VIALFVVAALMAAGPDQDVPEIGRVKSNAPACAALRDLVIPSLLAAARVDQQFAQAAPQFAAYAAAKAGATTLPTNMTRANGSPVTSRTTADEADSPTPDLYLARLDKALAGMQKDLLSIGKALGDPRIAADSTDPSVQAEREQLGVLYVVQAARIATLMEFLGRERKSRIDADRSLTDQSALHHATGAASQSDDLAAAAAAALSSGHVPYLVGQPQLNGLAANDKQSVNDWTAGIAKAVRESESTAVKKFAAVAQTCG